LWQKFDDAKITAMSIVTTVLFFLVIVIAAEELVRLIRGDGYGHRPPPPSDMESLMNSRR